MDEREKLLKEIGKKWDSLYRHAAWEGVPDAEAMRQFDLYMQKLTLPQFLIDKFPPKVGTS